MVVKFNLYTNSCINDILIDKKKYPLVKNPKISAIIPIYNGGKYLHYSLRSIQNQKMKDIEIILIDDFSNDTTLKIIEKYMKEDERIRLIKNIENRKILYSKSFAALNSKGKYIIELDQDDMFIRDDVFDILYYEAEKDDLDLVHIRDITKRSLVFESLTKVNIGGRHFINSKKTHYKKQPELKDKMFIQGNNYLLWGLLIKSDIYKKAIYHLWPLIINYKIVYHEDYTITFMLIILAKKYKYLNHYAFIHLLHSNSTSHGYMNNNNYFLGVLFFGNTLFDYHINKNPKDIGIFIHFYKFSKKSMNKGKKIFPKLYNFLINNVIINQYISNEQRQFFQKNLNSSSKYIKNFEFEAIYNHQIANSNKKKRNKVNFAVVY
jgi:glycosyltransferase involved in cell wall biosynthesis